MRSSIAEQERPRQRRRVDEVLPDGPAVFDIPPPQTPFPPTSSTLDTTGSTCSTASAPSGGPLYLEAAPIVHPPQVNAEFGSDLCLLMIACNIAWWVVEHPYFLAFFRKWVPGVIVPGRQQLSGRILNEEADKVMASVRSRVQGKHATGACDGWKNVKRDALIASTANVEGEAILLNVSDISGEPKTAETLLDIVVKEIKYMVETLLLVVVAWCTDASGESAKMRRLLVRKYPWLVVLDCWGHQVR
ncbi:hypothetical protein EV121DRAFT_218242 [Schizophyllum commune]